MKKVERMAFDNIEMYKDILGRMDLMSLPDCTLERWRHRHFVI